MFRKSFKFAAQSKRDSEYQNNNVRHYKKILGLKQVQFEEGEISVSLARTNRDELRFVVDSILFLSFCWPS